MAGDRHGGVGPASGRGVEATSRISPPTPGDPCVRLTIPFLLLIAGVVAGVLVTVPRESTWKAVWIGVASTLIAAGLVDLFAQSDARQRENAAISLAGERIEKVHRDLVSILNHMLDTGDGSEGILAKFGELDDQEVRFDLNQEADVYPPGLTKLSQVVTAREKIVGHLDMAVALGMGTWIAARVERVDRRIRDDSFFAGPIFYCRVSPCHDCHRCPVRSSCAVRSQLQRDTLV